MFSLGLYWLSSAMTFSVDRWRYRLPNMPVTEQKVQSKGQPREVCMGMVERPGPWMPIFVSEPMSSREKSGNGSESRSSTGGALGFWRTVPLSFQTRPGTSAKEPFPFKASARSGKPASPSPTMT